MNSRFTFTPLLATLVIGCLAGCDTSPTEGPNTMPEPGVEQPTSDLDTTNDYGGMNTPAPGADATTPSTTPGSQGMSSDTPGTSSDQSSDAGGPAMSSSDSGSNNPSGGTIEDKDVTEVEPNQ